MPVEEITLEEFNSLKPQRQPGTEEMVREEAWFADKERSLISTVFFDRSDKDWAFVIMGRDKKGAFRCVEVDSSLPTKYKAKAAMLVAIKKLLEPGDLPPG